MLGMELKPIKISDISELNHVAVIISDGKIRVAELPKFGNVQINCGNGSVQKVQEITDTKFN